MAIPQNLLQAVEEFYRRAMRHDILRKLSAPIADFYDDAPPPVITQRDEDEDLGEYDELIQTAQQVSDPSLSSELQLIAEMYKKALEIGGGYNAINKAISNMINIYLDDEDDPEQEMVETVLNKVVKDLRNRVGGAAGLARPDSPAVIAQLKQLKEEYNRQHLEEEVDDLSKYEEAAAPTFDFTSGMGKEEAGKGSGRGYSVQTRKTNKDWVTTFENEKQRYLDKIATATDSRVATVMKQLADVLNQLRDNMEQEVQLANQISITPDAGMAEQLKKLQESSKKLKADRRALKLKIRKYELAERSKELQNELRSTRDPKEKFKLEQETKLYDLLQSKDLFKGEERNWRLVLLKSVSGGNMPSAGTLANIQKKIEEAAAKKKLRGDYEKEDAAKVRALKEGKTLPGLIVHLQQKIATLKKDTAQVVKNKAKKDPVFAPYKEAVRLAAERVKTDPSPENQAALKAAEKSEVEALTNYLNNDRRVKAVVADNVVLYAYRDKMRALEKMLSTEGAVVPQEVINESEDLYRQLGSVYGGIGITLKEIIDLLKSRAG
jgi:hypothetical protein